MNREELVQALRRARVPDALYDIPGVRNIRMKPDAYYFLRTEAGGWVVGLSERGRDSVMARFSSEDEACRDLYARLTTTSSSSPPDAKHRVEEVLSRREEIQRRAWDAFGRAPSRRPDPPPR